jgi:hypothetical protein
MTRSTLSGLSDESRACDASRLSARRNTEPVRSVAAVGIDTLRSNTRPGIEMTAQGRSAALAGHGLSLKSCTSKRSFLNAVSGSSTAGTAGDRCERVRLRGCAGAAGPPVPQNLKLTHFRRQPLRVQRARLLLLTTISYYRRTWLRLRQPHPRPI